MDPSLVSIASGLVAHAVCNRTNPRTRFALASMLFLAPFMQTIITRPSQPFSFLVRAELNYIITLSLSTIAFRLSPFHPLARYPGPLLARVSSLWMVWTAINGKQHITYRHLHDVYGDIVRTGPRHVHIRSAAAIRTVLGAQDQWRRYEGYELLVPPGGAGSILSVTDPASHKLRRRVWDRAFSNAALSDYRPMLNARIVQLRDGLDERCGDTVDISTWLTWFTLDFMGDFAFGGTFNFMTRAADPERLHSTIVGAMKTINLVSSVPWVRSLVHMLPGPLDNLLRAAVELVKRKRATLSDEKDLFYHLSRASSSEELSDDILAQDALVAVVAGSDTSASVLANAIYYILSTPGVFNKLRDELDTVTLTETAEDWAMLAKCQFLQAVINETMRLAPATPNGAPHVSPRGRSVLVAGYDLPENTVVHIPSYALFRDRRYFSPDPDMFVPERWMRTSRHFAHDDTAFIPFSFGPTSCVGKQLALAEVRAVLAMLVQRYDMKFAPGYDHSRWEHDLEDQFILIKGSLPIIMRPRTM